MSVTALRAFEANATLLERPAILDDLADVIAFEQERWAHKQWLLERSDDPLASFLTGTNMELIYASAGAGTAKNTFTAEAQINDTAGMGPQASLPPGFWLPNKGEICRGIRIVGRGIVSSTATPTYTFTTRFGAAGSTATAIVLGSAALTTGSGITNQMWEFQGDVIMEIVGAAGTNSTVRGIGLLASGGLASPFSYPLYGGAASPGTVATVDRAIENFINFNVACSASSASNTITLQQLLVFGLN